MALSDRRRTEPGPEKDTMAEKESPTGRRSFVIRSAIAFLGVAPAVKVLTTGSPADAAVRPAERVPPPGGESCDCPDDCCDDYLECLDGDWFLCENCYDVDCSFLWDQCFDLDECC
jgi:hypothetical protein